MTRFNHFLDPRSVALAIAVAAATVALAADPAAKAALSQFEGMDASMRRVCVTFLLLAFIVPVMLIVAGIRAGSIALLAAAFATQYVGLAFERWFFLAQANHPQNLYYQNRS